MKSVVDLESLKFIFRFARDGMIGIAILDFSARWKTTRVGETHASKMKLRLLKGKRKKKERKKSTTRRGDQSPGRGIEL